MPIPVAKKLKATFIVSDVPCQSGKVGYPTAFDAEKAQKNLKRKHKGKTTFYKCPHCEQFHLTSSKGRKGKMKM